MPAKRRNRIDRRAKFPRESWEREYTADLLPRMKTYTRAVLSAMDKGGYIKRFKRYIDDTYYRTEAKADFDREADKLTFERMTARLKRDYTLDIADIIADLTPQVFEAGSGFGFAKLGVDALWKLDSPQVRQAIDQRLNLTKTVSDTVFDEILDTIRTEVYEAGRGPVSRELLDAIQKKAGLKTQYQAERIARTEVLAVQSAGTDTAWRENGVTSKEWIAALDMRTRDSHASLDGQVVAMDAAFSNGLQFPGADGPASEVVNCRCSHAPIYDDATLDRIYSEGVYTG